MHVVINLNQPNTDMQKVNWEKQKKKIALLKAQVSTLDKKITIQQKSVNQYLN